MSDLFRQGTNKAYQDTEKRHQLLTDYGILDIFDYIASAKSRVLREADIVHAGDYYRYRNNVDFYGGLEVCISDKNDHIDIRESYCGSILNYDYPNFTRPLGGEVIRFEADLTISEREDTLIIRGCGYHKTLYLHRDNLEESRRQVAYAVAELLGE